MAFSIGYFILYTVLMSQICNSQDCTTKKGDSCIFPVEYKSKTYTGCKPDEEKSGRPWCSTQVDRTGRHIEGRRGVTWGFCSTDCPVEGDQECEETRQCTNSKECQEYTEFKKMSRSHPDYQIEINKWVSRICNIEEKRLCCSKPKPVGKAGNLELKPPVELKNSAGQEPSGKYLPPLGQCGKDLSPDRVKLSISGGVNAGLGEFPWAALLGYTIKKRRQQYPSQKWVLVNVTEFRCGGSLINSRYVLTAAHCHTSVTKISSVILGEWQVGMDPDCPGGSRDRSSCKPRRQKIEVERVTIHEGYRKDKTNGEVVNDIALIRLKKPAVLNEAVQPICLPLNEEDTADEIGAENLEEGIVGRDATIIGWGATGNGASTNTDCQGVPNCILQKVDIPIISNEKCQSELNELNQESTIRSSHICAASYEDKSRDRDSCKRDSGGGMFISKNLDDKTDDTYYQVGIVSYGLSRYCGIGYPGVYTRISEFIPWIKENLRD